LKIFCWSMILVTMMYQEPIDMIDRMIRVARATKPASQTAEIPNGFSTSSLAAGAGAAGAAAGAAAASAAGAAGASAAGAEAAAEAGASAIAGALTRAVAAVTENSTAASTADKRVFLNMLPPNLKINQFAGLNDNGLT